MVPRLRIAGCATWAIASVNSGACAAISDDLSRSAWRVRAPILTISPVTAMPAQLGDLADIDDELRRNQRADSWLASGSGRPTAPSLCPRAPRAIPARRRRWLRVRKRKPQLSFGVTSPVPFWHIFLWIRRRRPLKVKFVYRTIISDDWASGLVIMVSMARRSFNQSGASGGSDEFGILHDADSSPRQGLAAIPERRP